MSTITRPFLLVLGLLFVASPAFAADSANVIKDRMLQRQPTLEKMWAHGLIGENNTGYITPMTELSKDQTQIVAQENADRKQIYSMIASQTSSTPEQVGAQRALRIAQGADKGLWIQSKEGKWYRK